MRGRKHLAGPQRRKRSIEREPNVGVAARALGERRRGRPRDRPLECPHSRGGFGCDGLGPQWPEEAFGNGRRGIDGCEHGLRPDPRLAQ